MHTRILQKGEISFKGWLILEISLVLAEKFKIFFLLNSRVSEKKKKVINATIFSIEDCFYGLYTLWVCIIILCSYGDMEFMGLSCYFSLSHNAKQCEIFLFVTFGKFE